MPLFGAYEDEEEEEEEEFFRPRPRKDPPVQPQHEEEEEEEEDLDAPAEEDVLRVAGRLVQGAWEQHGGLRQRRGADFGTPPEARRALLLDDDDAAGFELGSERLHVGARPDLDQGSMQVWRQLCLAVLVLAGAWVAATDRRPTRESFEHLRDARYGGNAGAGNGTGLPGGLVYGWKLPVLVDRSFQGQVAWSRYVDHGPLALATVCLKVSTEPGALAKSKPAPAKVYEHRYLGAFGVWLPLPYLPQPGQKPGTYGLGLCVLGRCVCVPKLGKAPAPKAGKDGKPEKPAKRPGMECWRFQGGKSAALNVMAIPNGVLFMLWQFPQNWGMLAAHATLSMANLSRGRLWVLLSAPFSHRHWGEAFHSAVLLTNALDSFDRAEVSFAVFLALYLGGCWAAWLGRGVLWRRVLKNDPSAFYVQEWGATGGLAAQLLFLARVRPHEQFQFSLYLIPIPVTLSAWQSCFAHGLLDVVQARGEVWRQLLAHAAAWAVGWLIASAWLQHP